jgi:hypothetical protein
MSQFVLLTTAAALAAKPPKPGDWTFGWDGVASIAAASLAIVVCLWFTSTYYSAERDRNRHSPWQLFADLCKAHKLSRRERYLLQQLAGLYQLDQPAMLFIEPSWYSAEKVAATVGQPAELDRLRQRLFAAH